MLRLTLKTTLLVSIVAGIQLAIVSFDRDSTLDHFEAVLDNSPEILLFGDSTNGAWDPRDSDRRPISMVLDAELAIPSVGGFAHAAYHSEIYELFLTRLLARPYRPRLLIIPINLRSLSPVWDFDPSTQLDAVRRKLVVEESAWRRAVEPLALTFGVGSGNATTRHDYMNRPVYRVADIVGTVSEYRNGDTDQQLVLNYMYGLDAGHRKVTALKRIAEMAQDQSLPVVFYVTPVDYCAASPDLRKPLVDQIRRNVEVVCATLSRTEAVLVDMAFDLDSESFSYGRHVNEHLRSVGRTYVAGRLAEIVKPVSEGRAEVLATDPRVLLR